MLSCDVKRSTLDLENFYRFSVTSAKANLERQLATASGMH